MRVLRYIGWGIAVASLALAIVFGIWMGTGLFASWQREVVLSCQPAEPTRIFTEVTQMSGRSIRVRVSNHSTHPLALSQKQGENGIAVSMSIFYRSWSDLGIPVDDRAELGNQPAAIPPGGYIEREVNLAMLVEKQAIDNHGEIIHVPYGTKGLNPLANVPFKAETFVGLNTKLCGNVELLPPTKIIIAMPDTCQFAEACANHGRDFISLVRGMLLAMGNLSKENE